MRYLTYILVVLMVGAGCASNQQKTQKEEAKLQWNRARASVLVSLASDQYATGNLDKCRETLDQALRMDPTNPRLHLLAAKLTIEQSQLESAQRSLDTVRQLDPKNAEADYLSGVIYQRWQRPETSLTYYTSAFDKAPAELAYLLAKAEMLVELKRSPEALQMLQERLAYFEHSSAIRDAAGQLLVQSKQYDAGIELFRQASILAEDDQAVREHLGLALYQNQQYRDAAEAIGRLLKVEGYAQRSDLLAVFGECHMALGKFRDARNSFEAAAQLNASSPTIWLGFAKAALASGDLDRADLATRKARTLDAKSSEAALLMGYIRLKQSRLADALDAFKQSYELDQKDTVSLCMVGLTLQRLGESQQAMNCYARALQLKPNDDLARKLMAAIDFQE